VSHWIGPALVLTSAAGCRVGDAVIDGAYGGISDTVAGIISGVILGTLGL
jgi:hypothetical protein